MATHSHMTPWKGLLTVKVEKFGPEKKLYISYFFKCIHLNRKITINRRGRGKEKLGRGKGKTGKREGKGGKRKGEKPQKTPKNQ